MRKTRAPNTKQAHTPQLKYVLCCYSSEKYQKNHSLVVIYTATRAYALLTGPGVWISSDEKMVGSKYSSLPALLVGLAVSMEDDKTASFDTKWLSEMLLKLMHLCFEEKNLLALLMANCWFTGIQHLEAVL